ncbi:MAG: PAS domain S-box protein [Desulfobacter sp.]|nr:PAS domain S-box protein [Desulfobacter sp.]
MLESKTIIFFIVSILAAKIHWLYKESDILGNYSLPEFAMGKRDIPSLVRLFSLEQNAYPENIAHVYMDAPNHVLHSKIQESLTGAEAKRMAVKWADRYWAGLKTPEQGPMIPDFHITPGYQMMGMLFPVRVQDSLKGVLAVVIDLRPMVERYIAPIRSGQYGAAYLLDEKGTIVYDHETQIIGRNIFDGIHANHPDLERVDNRLVNEKTGTDEYRFTVHREGNRVSRKLIAWNTLYIGDHSLIVCISAPDIEINKSLYGIRLQRNISGIFLTLVIIVMSMVFFLSRQQILKNSNRQLQETLGKQTAKLRQSEEKYRTVVEKSPMGISIIDHSGCYGFVNQEFCRISGYTESELLKKPFFFNIAETSMDKVLKRYEKRMQGEPLQEVYEVSFVHNNGHQREALVRSVVYNNHEDQTSYLVQVLDITQRKQAEQAVIESEKKYRTLFDSSVDSISIIDVDTGNFIDCNDAAVKLHNTKVRENFIGLTPEQLSPEFQPNGKSSRQLGAEYIRTAVEKGVKIFEWTHCKRDGTLFTAFVSLSALLLPQKNLVLAISKDMTELKQAEQERERLIKDLQTALEDIKTLSGLLPICSKCKKIRDDKGYWNTLEEYLECHSNIMFSHGLCA